MNKTFLSEVKKIFDRSWLVLNIVAGALTLKAQGQTSQEKMFVAESKNEIGSVREQATKLEAAHTALAWHEVISKSSDKNQGMEGGDPPDSLEKNATGKIIQDIYTQVEAYVVQSDTLSPYPFISSPEKFRSFVELFVKQHAKETGAKDLISKKNVGSIARKWLHAAHFQSNMDKLVSEGKCFPRKKATQLWQPEEFERAAQSFIQDIWYEIEKEERQNIYQELFHSNESKLKPAEILKQLGINSEKGYQNITIEKTISDNVETFVKFSIQFTYKDEPFLIKFSPNGRMTLIALIWSKAGREGYDASTDERPIQGRDFFNTYAETKDDDGNPQKEVSIDDLKNPTKTFTLEYPQHHSLFELQNIAESLKYSFHNRAVYVQEGDPLPGEIAKLEKDIQDFQEALKIYQKDSIRGKASEVENEREYQEYELLRQNSDQYKKFNAQLKILFEQRILLALKHQNDPRCKLEPYDFERFGDNEAVHFLNEFLTKYAGKYRLYDYIHILLNQEGELGNLGERLTDLKASLRETPELETNARRAKEKEEKRIGLEELQQLPAFMALDSSTQKVMFQLYEKLNDPPTYMELWIDFIPIYNSLTFTKTDFNSATTESNNHLGDIINMAEQYHALESQISEADLLQLTPEAKQALFSALKPNLEARLDKLRSIFERLKRYQGTDTFPMFQEFLKKNPFEEAYFDEILPLMEKHAQLLNDSPKLKKFEEKYQSKNWNGYSLLKMITSVNPSYFDEKISAFDYSMEHHNGHYTSYWDIFINHLHFSSIYEETIGEIDQIGPISDILNQLNSVQKSLLKYTPFLTSISEFSDFLKIISQVSLPSEAQYMSRFNDYKTFKIDKYKQVFQEIENRNIFQSKYFLEYAQKEIPFDSLTQDEKNRIEEETDIIDIRIDFFDFLIDHNVPAESILKFLQSSINLEKESKIFEKFYQTLRLSTSEMSDILPVLKNMEGIEECIILAPCFRESPDKIQIIKDMIQYKNELKTIIDSRGPSLYLFYTILKKSGNMNGFSEYYPLFEQFQNNGFPLSSILAENTGNIDSLSINLSQESILNSIMENNDPSHLTDIYHALTDENFQNKFSEIYHTPFPNLDTKEKFRITLEYFKRFVSAEEITSNSGKILEELQSTLTKLNDQEYDLNTDWDYQKVLFAADPERAIRMQASSPYYYTHIFNGMMEPSSNDTETPALTPDSLQTIALNLLTSSDNNNWEKGGKFLIALATPLEDISFDMFRKICTSSVDQKITSKKVSNLLSAKDFQLLQKKQISINLAINLLTHYDEQDSINILDYFENRIAWYKSVKDETIFKGNVIGLLYDKSSDTQAASQFLAGDAFNLEAFKKIAEEQGISAQLYRYSEYTEKPGYSENIPSLFGRVVDTPGDATIIIGGHGNENVISFGLEHFAIVSDEINDSLYFHSLFEALAQRIEGDTSNSETRLVFSSCHSDYNAELILNAWEKDERTKNHPLTIISSSDENHPSLKVATDAWRVFAEGSEILTIEKFYSEIQARNSILAEQKGTITHNSNSVIYTYQPEKGWFKF